MKEHGLYIIKQEFFDMIVSLGGECDIDSGNKRPVYCCIKDKRIDGLYWAVPTSDIAHRSQEQVDKINMFLSLPETDLRSCYYYIGRTTRPAVYKISSCFPITDKYIDHEFTTNGQHVIIRRKEHVDAIEQKLRRILAFESRRPNYFSQRITDVKQYLLNELSQQES